MHYNFPPDIEGLVREQMALGGYQTEDEVLRDALGALRHFAPAREAAEAEFRDAVEAVKEGIADMEAGRMRPLQDVLQDARRNTHSAE